MGKYFFINCGESLKVMRQVNCETYDSMKSETHYFHLKSFKVLTKFIDAIYSFHHESASIRVNFILGSV